MIVIFSRDQLAQSSLSPKFSAFAAYYSAPRTSQWNQSNSVVDWWQGDIMRYSLIACHVIIALLSLFSNFAIMYAVLRNRKMHTVINFYLMNFAACSLATCVFILPGKLIELISASHLFLLSDRLCSILHFLQTLFTLSGILTLMVGCLERYRTIVRPLQSNATQSGSHTFFVILLVWILPALAALPLLGYGKAITIQLGSVDQITCLTQMSQTIRLAYLTLCFALFFVTPALIICAICTCIAIRLTSNPALHRQDAMRRQELNRRKVAKMIVIEAISFLICWTPFTILFSISQYQGVQIVRTRHYLLISLTINLLVFCHSLITPLILLFMSTRFRSGFAQFARLLFFCTNPIIAERDELSNLSRLPDHRRRPSLKGVVEPNSNEMLVLSRDRPEVVEGRKTIVVQKSISNPVKSTSKIKERFLVKPFTSLSDYKD